MIHNDRELIEAGARVAAPKHRFSVAADSTRIAELDAIVADMNARGAGSVKEITRNTVMNLALIAYIKRYRKGQSN